MRLQQMMDSVEGRIVADAVRIEKATSGMVSLGGATAQIVAFGNAATKRQWAEKQSVVVAEPVASSAVEQQ